MALKHLSLPQTQLLVRMTRDYQGQVVPQLADAAGVPLPMQRKVSMAYTHDGLAEVTVTFGVDGDQIRLLPDCQEGNL